MKLGTRLRDVRWCSVFHRRVDKALRDDEQYPMTSFPTTRNGTALITGASSGLGVELARLFAADRHDVVLVARSESKLQQLATELNRTHGIRALVLATDLARPSAASKIADHLHAEGLDVDYLVNDAGFGLIGPFLSTSHATELAMIQVNVVALTELTKLLLPAMIARGRGRILNVASTAAFVPGPFMAVYYATKAYVLSLSQALSNELHGSGVTVTALCPGPTRTGFAASAGEVARPTFQARMVMEASTVARAGYRGMMRGETTVVPGLLNKLLTQSTRLLPRAMQARITRRVAERRFHA
jgi:short-subunit dehydrogenase